MCEFHGKSLDDLINHKRKPHTMDASCLCSVCDFVGRGMGELKESHGCSHNVCDIHM